MAGSIRQTLAAVLSWSLHAAIAAIGHRWVLRNANRAVSLPVPVISVGNITLGGTAKTPTAVYLARALAGRGFRPGVVFRGYKGRIDREKAPPQVVSDGKGIRLYWTDAGDEASLAAEELIDVGVPVAVGRDRASASRLLIEGHGADIIILDDGFQFTALHRDFDLVLIDALAPFGRSDGLMGLLREPVGALGRADAILITHCEAVMPDRVEEIRLKLRAMIADPPPIFTARTTVSGMRNCCNVQADSGQGISGRIVAAFAGIGNPLSFEHTVGTLGCELAEMIRFRDHHVYARRDLGRIERRARKTGAEIVLTTAKDAVRLNGMTDAMSLPMWVVNIEVVVDDEDELLGRVMRSVGERAAFPKPAVG